MLTSILPVVHGVDDLRGARRRWLGLALMHSLASMLAAASVGLALGLASLAAARAGFPIEPIGRICAALVAIVYLPRLLGWTRFPVLLQSTRQVPRRWAFDHPRPVAAVLFGLGLGSGLYTRVTVPSYYLLFLWPFAYPGLVPAALVWALYGLVRSAHVWWLALHSPIGDPFPSANALIAALMSRGTLPFRANAIVMTAVVILLAIGIMAPSAP